MTIYFNNNMGIQTDTNFRILGTDGSTVRSQIDATSGMLEKSQPVWQVVYYGDGNQAVFGSGKIPFNVNYGGEGNHYNFSTYEFICPVPGNYRMSMHVLTTGNVYANSGIHWYGYHNGTFISNGGHLVGSMNYATTHWICNVRAAAGDYLWFSSGGGRMYTGGWLVATYQLLG